MDFEADRARDYAVRAQVIPTLNYVESMISARDSAEHSMDFMLERDTSPVEGITRRYPMIAILKPVLTCPQICVYCQRNWEIEDVHSSDSILSKDKLDKALQWLSDTPEINEVLLTGGDPFPFVQSTNRGPPVQAFKNKAYSENQNRHTNSCNGPARDYRIVGEDHQSLSYPGEEGTHPGHPFRTSL